jgi:hypothetical protein
MKHTSITTMALIALTVPAAAESPILGLDSINVIAGWRQSDGSHMAAIDIQLEKGWKTYWRVAGGGGIPPQFDWSKSENISGFDVKWPAPSVFHDYDQQTIGYKDALILPIVFHPIDANKPMHISGTIDFGVCENVCVPVQSALNATLPPRAAIGKSVIKKALKNVARSGKSAGVKIKECTFTPVKGGFAIQAALENPNGFNKHAVGILEYPSGPNDWLQQQPSTISGYQLAANAILYAKNVSFIDRSKLRITVLSKGKAVEIHGCT